MEDTPLRQQSGSNIKTTFLLTREAKRQYPVPL
jgi:hypothetical protein